MITIHLETPIDLPVLEPSDGLLYEYHSAELIDSLIKSNSLEYSAQSLKTWAESSLQNKKMFEAVKRLLGMKYQLSDYKECFKNKFLKELDTPEGKASLLLYRIHKDHVSDISPILKEIL